MHQLHGKLAFECRLDGHDQRGGVLVAPRRVLAERLAVPLAEVRQPGLAGQLAPVVVNPVPREHARALDVELRASVGVQGEVQRRPHGRRLPLHVRRVRDPARRRHSGLAAARLGERDLAVAGLRRLADLGERDGLERAADRANAHRGGADADAAVGRVAGVGDPARPVGLDPRLEHVREPELVGLLQCGEALLARRGELVGRRVVVMREPALERGLHGAGDRLRGDPGERGDTAFISHTPTLCRTRFTSEGASARFLVYLPLPYSV